MLDLINKDVSYLFVNKILRVVFPSGTYLPYVNVAVTSNETVYSGAVVELLKKISSYLNFKLYEIVPSVDDNYGGLVNNTWNGMVGMAHRKEVDMIVAPLTITYMRSSVIDFSEPFASDSIGIMIRRPQKKISLWNLILVFDPSVWLTILGSVVGAVLITRLLYWLDIVRPQCCKKETIFYCFWLIFGGLLNQLCIIPAKTWSSRIFQLCWRICVVLLIATYAGSLVAALTTDRMSLPFQDLKGLAAAVSKGEYKVCTPFGTAFYTAVMTDDLAEYKIIKQWLTDHMDFASPSFSDCTDKLLTLDNVAYIHEVAYLQTVQIEHCSDCPLILLQDRFFPGYLAFGFQKRSPLNEPVSQAITELYGTGLVDGWKWLFSEKPKFCKTIDASETVIARTQKLMILDLGGSFILFFVGITVGSLVIIIERNFKREIDSAEKLSGGST